MSSINDLISRASNGIINMDAPKRAPQPKQLTQRQMQVNEILRTGGKRLARISQLRREVATRSNRSWLQRTKEDTLDANTPEDRLARMQKGLPEMYKDEQEQVYNRRTIGDNFNAFDQIAGPVTQWTNTISARALEVPETLRGQVASMTNNEKALNASVKRQEDLRNRLYSGGGGWFNKGTIFDSPEEAKSPDSRHVWRGLGGTVDAASFGLGGSLRKAGVQLYRQGAKQSAKNLATRQGQRELSKMAGSGALGTVGFDLATNRDVSPGSVITSGITGAVGGVGIGVGAPLLARGATRGSAAAVRGAGRAARATGRGVNKVGEAATKEFKKLAADESGHIINPFAKDGKISPLYEGQKKQVFRGKDGKPRLEISDDRMSVRWQPKRVKHTPYKLSTVIDHDRLFEHSPELKDLNVVFTDKFDPNQHGAFGKTNNGEEALFISNRFNKSQLSESEMNKLKNVIVHEIDHALQKKHDFAAGGGLYYKRSEVKQLRSLHSEINRRRKEFDELNYQPTSTEESLNKAWQKFINSYAKRIRVERAAYKRYRKLTGEVDARATATRRTMTPEQRKLRPFTEDLDVPVDEQILATQSQRPGDIFGEYRRPPRGQKSLFDTDKPAPKPKPKVTSKKTTANTESGGQRLFKLQDELTEHSFPTNMTGTKIENTGDIFRELAKSGGKPYGRGYIGEKIYKLKTGFGLDDRGFPLKNDISDIKSGRNVAKYNAEMDAWQNRLKKLEQETLKEPDTPLRKAMLDTLDLQRDVAEWYRNPSTNYGNIPKKITALEKQIEALHSATPGAPPKPKVTAKQPPKKAPKGVSPKKEQPKVTRYEDIDDTPPVKKEQAPVKPKVTSKQSPKKATKKAPVKANTEIDELAALEKKSEKEALTRAEKTRLKELTSTHVASDKPKTPKKKPYKTQNPSQKSRLAPKDTPANPSKKPQVKFDKKVKNLLTNFSKQLQRKTDGQGKVAKLTRSDNFKSMSELLSPIKNLKGSKGKLGASEHLVAKIQQADNVSTERSLHYRGRARDVVKGMKKSDRVSTAELLDNPKLNLKKMTVSQISKKAGVSKKVAKAAKDLRKISDDILFEVNKARKAEGRKPITSRKGHLFHLVKDRDPVFTEGGFLPTQIRAGASKARTGTTKQYEMDVAVVYDRYIDMMMRDAHMTKGLNIAVGMRDIMAQTPGQDKNATWMTRQIQSNILGRPTEYGVLADVSLGMTPGSKLAKSTDAINRARADSVLLASPRFLLTQTLSGARTVGETGPLNAIKGLGTILASKENRARLRGYYSYQSKNMNSISKAGMGDVSARTSKPWSKYLGYVHTKMENAMTMHALASGEHYAKSVGFKPGTADFRILADGMAQVTQSMYDRLNRAQVLNSRTTRTLNPFQTFSVEAWRAAKRATGMGGGRVEGAGKNVYKMVSEIGAIVAFNKMYEVATLQEKTTVGSYVPFVGSIVDNAIEEGRLRYKAENGSEEEKRRAKDELKYREEQMTSLERYLTKPGGKFWMTAPAGHISKIVYAADRYIDALQSDDPEAKNQYASYRDAVREFSFWAGGAMGLPANQMFNMFDGYLANERGYTMTSTGNVRSPITTTEDKIRSVATGQNNTRAAQNSFNNDLPVLSGDTADEFRDIEDPQERQEFYDKKVKELRAYFDDRNDNHDFADRHLNDEEKSVLAKLDAKKEDDYKEKTSGKEQLDKTASRYQDMLSTPKAVDVLRDREERARKRGEEPNPLWDESMLKTDPNHDVSRFERVLRWRASRSLRSGGQAYTKDGESLFVSLGLDAKWYEDFRKKEGEFYDKLEEEGVFEQSEARLTYSGAKYVEMDDKTQAVFDKYNKLPTGDGSRGGNKSRWEFLNNTDEGALLLKHWAKSDQFTNAERIAIGLKPILKDEDGNVIDSKTGKAKTSYGSSGSSGGSRGSSRSGSSSSSEPKAMDENKYAIRLRSGVSSPKPTVSTGTRAKTTVARKSSKVAKPKVSLKRSKV